MEICHYKILSILIVDARCPWRRLGKRKGQGIYDERKRCMKQKDCSGGNLHKVRHGSASGHHALIIRDGVENLEVSVEILVELEDAGHVAAAVAVVGGRPHGDKVLLGEHVLVALLHELMRPANELQPVDSRELVKKRLIRFTSEV
jgi:hypothetical protein